MRGEAKRRAGVGTVIPGAGPGGAKIPFSFCFSCAPLPSYLVSRAIQILRTVPPGEAEGEEEEIFGCSTEA